MSTLACPAGRVQELRRHLYYQLGQEFAEACVLQVTREPEMVRDLLGDHLARIEDLRKLLGEVGWKDLDEEIAVKVTDTSEAFKRAWETRNLASEGCTWGVRDRVLTIRWWPAGGSGLTEIAEGDE